MDNRFNESHIHQEYKFDNLSEIIAKVTIEKIISYTFTKVIITKIDNKIPKHCFNYVSKMFNDIISCTNILYDRDDTRDCENRIYFDERYYGLNNWETIDEPKRSNPDRAATTRIQVQKVQNIYTPSQEEIKENKLENSVLSGNMVDRKNTNDTKLVSNNKLLNVTQKINIDKRDVSNTSEKNRHFEIYLLNDMQSQPDEELVVQNTRAEIIRETKKKEEEMKIKLQNEKDQLNHNKIEYKKQKDIVNGYKHTFDCKGEVIHIKLFPSEKLPSDFLSGKVNIIDKQEISLNPLINFKNEALRKKSVLKVTNKESEVKTTTVVEPNKVPQPAGSNYDLIVPETGVTINESSKSKGGIKYYDSKSRKFSKTEYYSMLKDFTPNPVNTTENKVVDDFKISLPVINQNNTMMLFNQKNTKNNALDTIKINNLNVSLKTTFDELDLLPELNEMSRKFNATTENVLKKRKNDDEMNKTNLDDMNKFTLSIVKNKNWGAQGDDKIISRYTELKPIKLNTKELIKEVGINVINKLPRKRK